MWPHPQPQLASPPTPLRMERGVVCEVTPFGLLKEGEEILYVHQTCRGISVITEGVSKCTHPLFYAQGPDFLKPGLCYFLKFLYL